MSTVPLSGKYTIPGEPIAWARARTNNGRYYDSQVEEKRQFGWWVVTHNQSKILKTGPVQLQITFYMPIPKSLSKKAQAQLDGTYHFKKPDTSNLVKFVEDAIKDILYLDDCIIADIIARKIYSFEPRTEFTLTELDIYPRLDA